MERYLKNSNYSILMNKRDLEKLSKEELIELLLKKEKKPKVDIVDTKPKRLNRQPPPIPKKEPKIKDRSNYYKNPATRRWIRIGSKTYKRLFHTNKILNPATNRYIDIEGRTYQKLFPKLHKRNVAIRRTIRNLTNRAKKIDKASRLIEKKYDELVLSPKITQLRKALKGSTKSFTVDVIDSEDPLHQLNETKNFIKKCLVKELLELKGFKYIETLKVTFEKKQGKGITTKTAFFNSKTKTLINAIEINEVLQSSREELVKAIAQWLSEGSGWTISSVDSHYINLTQYQPLKGGSYLELPTELKPK